MRSARAPRLTGAAPRWPCSSGAARTEEMRSDTSTSVSGGIRWPTSPSSSVGGPATLKLTTGPNSGSSVGVDDARDARLGHPLHDERVGRQRREPPAQRGERLAHARLAGQVDAHAAGADLVPEQRARSTSAPPGSPARRPPRPPRRRWPPRRWARPGCRSDRSSCSTSSATSGRPAGDPAITPSTSRSAASRSMPAGATRSPLSRARHSPYRVAAASARTASSGIE